MKTTQLIAIIACSIIINLQITAQFSLEKDKVDSVKIKSLRDSINVKVNTRTNNSREIFRDGTLSETAINNIIENYILSNEINNIEREMTSRGSVDGSNIDAIGSLSANLNNLSVSPALILSGNYEKDNFRFDLRLQVSSPSKDSSTNSNIFVNDKSLYALSFNTTFTPNDAFGLNFLFTYCGKNVTGIDSTVNIKKNEDFGVINLKFGVEFIPVPGKLSIYAFGNLNSAVSNVNNYETIVGGDKKKTTTYLECGVKGLVKLPGNTDGNDLILGFSMIFLNEDMRNILNDKDRIIPSISIGYSGNITNSK